jgi:hypothetical protein
VKDGVNTHPAHQNYRAKEEIFSNLILSSIFFSFFTKYNR